MHDDLAFGTIVVIGGGCYGSQYVRQLRRARAAGRATWDRVIVVDRDASCAFAMSRAADPTGASDVNGPADAWHGIELATTDWAAFIDSWLGAAAPAPASHARDAIVPSPLMPHLLFHWLLARARDHAPGRVVRAEMPSAPAGVPWERPGADGTRYVSYATWTCPVNCIEPATCPHTKSPRDWSLHTALGSASSDSPAAVLRVTHRTFGVGMIDVADVLAADALIANRLPAVGRVAIATASHCHGAYSVIVAR